METPNPCITCGACCAYFRTSFYWAESDLASPNGVPADLTERLNAFRMVMKGTNGPSPRCIALMGIIGKKVHCSIYGKRSSTCRNFDPAWLNGLPNERCDEARRAWGLPPLSPDIHHSPDHFPRAA